MQLGERLLCGRWSGMELHCQHLPKHELAQFNHQSYEDSAGAEDEPHTSSGNPHMGHAADERVSSLVVSEDSHLDAWQSSRNNKQYYRVRCSWYKRTVVHQAFVLGLGAGDGK